MATRSTSPAQAAHAGNLNKLKRLPRERGLELRDELVRRVGRIACLVAGEREDVDAREEPADVVHGQELEVTLSRREEEQQRLFAGTATEIYRLR